MRIGLKMNKGYVFYRLQCMMICVVINTIVEHWIGNMISSILKIMIK